MPKESSKKNAETATSKSQSAKPLDPQAIAAYIAAGGPERWVDAVMMSQQIDARREQAAQAAREVKPCEAEMTGA